jgi:Flp pilus assembly protein TadD
MISLAAGAEREAETHLRRALALRQLPAYAGNLGLLLLETKRSNEAEALLRLAHGLAPEDVDIMGNLADALKAESRLEEAEALYLRAIALDPRGTTALNNLGLLYWKQGRLQEAENHLQRALAVSPLLAVAHSNLGIVQKEMGQFKEAEASCRRALELHPQSSQFHNNLGLLFQETCRQEDAQQAFERALEIDPDETLARFNLSLTRLAFGDFARGLPGFEARYDRRLPAPPATLPDLPFVQWQGESLADKSLVIFPEQGFGDYLQFARYFPLLKTLGLAQLTVFCPTALAPLLRTAGGVDAVVSDKAELADHDYWAFPMSLALRCGSRIDTIPAQLPYLHALPERLAHWRAKLATPKRKVGLVWKGAIGHKNDHNRSLPSLDLLAPLWDSAEVQFFSLQKGQGEAEAQAAASAGRLVHLGSELNDLADTAAVVAQLDLVICVDTAIAHVAGALGKPCWVLLPAIGCDWRWHLERDDSPWYPGVMRLFRQGAGGNWPDMIAGLAQSLQALGEAPAGQGLVSG